MTAETNSSEPAKSVLAISMVMVKSDDRDGSDVKTISHTGADETSDLHSMVSDVTLLNLYFPGAQASQLTNPSPI
jgi:hypothetical protein